MIFLHLSANLEKFDNYISREAPMAIEDHGQFTIERSESATKIEYTRNKYRISDMISFLLASAFVAPAVSLIVYYYVENSYTGRRSPWGSAMNDGASFNAAYKAFVVGVIAAGIVAPLFSNLVLRSGRRSFRIDKSNLWTRRGSFPRSEVTEVFMSSGPAARVNDGVYVGGGTGIDGYAAAAAAAASGASAAAGHWAYNSFRDLRYKVGVKHKGRKITLADGLRPDIAKSIFEATLKEMNRPLD